MKPKSSDASRVVKLSTKQRGALADMDQIKPNPAYQAETAVEFMRRVRAGDMR